MYISTVQMGEEKEKQGKKTLPYLQGHQESVLSVHEIRLNN